MPVSLNRILETGRQHAFWALPFAILAATIIWKDELFALFYGDAVGDYETRTEALLGTRPGPEVLVRTAGGKAPVPLSSVLGADSIVAVYRPGCPPCQALVEHYVSRFEPDSARPDVKLLTFEDSVPLPAGIHGRDLLQAEFEATEGFFDNRLTPTIWRFKDGVLVDRMVGLNTGWLDSWLDEMASPHYAARP